MFSQNGESGDENSNEASGGMQSMKDETESDQNANNKETAIQNIENGRSDGEKRKMEKRSENRNGRIDESGDEKISENQGRGSQEMDSSQENRESPYFATARQVYDGEKYPAKKRKKEQAPKKAESGDDSENEDESKPPHLTPSQRRIRSSIYRHATGSSYQLNTIYGNLRKKSSNSVASDYKSVIDESRASNFEDNYQSDDEAPIDRYQNRSIDQPKKKEKTEKRKMQLEKFNGKQGNEKDDESESKRLADIVEREILDTSAITVTWEDIAGLGRVKKIIQEIVVWPMLRPEIFTGLRAPPKGLLLFGPPGTGKTTLGRCIASQAKATFYCISASSLTSKWVGENEKLVRALFDSARAHQPAVVFVDEIDALLSNRVQGEHDSTRRLKTQFFTELDGAKSFADERILVVGATNRPSDLDDAARRRLTKRLYVPLPDAAGRAEMMENLLKRESHSLTEESIRSIAERTEGFSCDDLKKMCQEAALGPIRRLTDITSVTSEELSPILEDDFDSALRLVRPSVGTEQLAQYEEFDCRFGSAGTTC